MTNKKDAKRSKDGYLYRKLVGLDHVVLVRTTTRECTPKNRSISWVLYSYIALSSSDYYSPMKAWNGHEREIKPGVAASSRPLPSPIFSQCPLIIPCPR